MEHINHNVLLLLTNASISIEVSIVSPTEVEGQEPSILDSEDETFYCKDCKVFFNLEDWELV